MFNAPLIKMFPSTDNTTPTVIFLSSVSVGIVEVRLLDVVVVYEGNDVEVEKLLEYFIVTKQR